MPITHPAVPTGQVSSFSTLRSALQEHRVSGSFVEDTFRVPRTSRGHPLRPLTPWRGQTKIKFDAMPDVYGGRGLPLALLSSGMAPSSVVRDGMEPVLGGSASGILTLRVSWPGYSDVDCVVKLPIRAPGTRQDVAMAVFEQYNRMFERARMTSAENHQGWLVGKTGITIHNVVLLSIFNDVDDVYEAEVDIVLSRNDPATLLAAAMRHYQ